MASKSCSRTRVLARALVGLWVCGIAVLQTPLPASAATGTISGTVTAGGQPVPPGAVQVVFVKYTNSICTTRPATNALAATTTGANGTYSMNLDTSFYYKIIFKPLSTAPRTAVFRWYQTSNPAGTTSGFNGANFSLAATCLTLTSAGLSGYNLSTNTSSVQLTGTLSTFSGQRTDNAAIALVRSTLCYYQSPDGYVTRPNELGQWEMAGVDTSQNDLYLQVTVPGGSCGAVYYAKRVPDGLTLIPSTDVATCAADCQFDISSTDLVNLDLRLPVTGRISGTISGPNGPVGAGEACVVAFKAGSDAMSFYQGQVGTVCTDETGQYTLDVTYDNYKVKFEGSPGSPYIGQWYRSSADQSRPDGYVDSTTLCVKTTGAGCATAQTVNFTLARGSSASGRITNSSGQGVGSATVHMMSQQSSGGWVPAGYATSNSDGNYSVSGLVSGTYTVMVSHPDHGQVWLGGTRENATSFAVSADVSGKDVSFPRGYAVSGTITTGDNSQARVCVGAYLVTEMNFGWGEFVNSQCFTAPGQWQLKGLKNGNYRLRFDAQTGNLRSTFLGGTDFSQATIVPVNGTDIANLDITIAAGKSITGKISNGDTGVPNAYVTAFRASENDWGWGTWSGGSVTNASGEYNIRGLEEGSYRLRVEPPNSSDFGPGFLSANGTLVRRYEDASLVAIASGDTVVEAVTQTLQSMPKITATVVDGADPKASVCVEALKITDQYSWGEFNGSSCSGLDGKVSLRGLSAGDYRLRINPQGGSYQSGWYRSSNTTTQSVSLATTVTLRLDDVALGNISLASGKRATGRVTNGSTPVAGACVGALKDNGSSWGEWSGSACTNSLGEFTIRGLDPAESYWFRVDIWVGDYKPGFVSSDGSVVSTTAGVTSRPASTDITLGDITLANAPSIKGRVTSGISTPEGNVCITAVDATTFQWITSTCSAPNGTFALRGLTAGDSYKLSWWTPNVLLASGWYKESSSEPPTGDGPNDSTAISVPVAGVSDLNIRLANGGVISGTIGTGQCVAAWLHPGSQSSSREDAAAVACERDGAYELRGLRPNTNYFLQVFKKDGTLIVQTSPSVETAVRTATTQNLVAS